MQLNDEAIASILRGLNYSDKSYVPQPTSSLVLKFYKSKDATFIYDRKNYYVDIDLDDKHLEIPGVCESGRCNWDILATYMESRCYKEGPLA